MIVAIHQPHFLPWTGYLNKVLHSQAFVWLNTVQYRKNYFQNRTRVKDPGDQLLWLTLPVHARAESLIRDVTIADSRWRERVAKTVECCYKRAPYFADCWPPLAAAMARAENTLDSVNYQCFLGLLELLPVPSPQVVRADELEVTSDDPTGRLVEICIQLGATHYIAGRGGHNYMRLDEFEEAGVNVLFQQFVPEDVVYPQLGKTFASGLSAIDCLFNIGPQQTVELLKGAWTPEHHACSSN